MDEDRLDKAVQRIGTAMDRLEAAVANRPTPSAITSPTANPNEEGLVERHNAMQAEVRASLSALDDLISGLER